MKTEWRIICRVEKGKANPITESSEYHHFTDRVVMRMVSEFQARCESTKSARLFENVDDGALEYHPEWAKLVTRHVRMEPEEVVAIIESDPELRNEYILNRMRK